MNLNVNVNVKNDNRVIRCLKIWTDLGVLWYPVHECISQEIIFFLESDTAGLTQFLTPTPSIMQSEVTLSEVKPRGESNRNIYSVRTDFFFNKTIYYISKRLSVQFWYESSSY